VLSVKGIRILAEIFSFYKQYETPLSSNFFAWQVGPLLGYGESNVDEFLNQF
jgi:hypothetical protein